MEINNKRLFRTDDDRVIAGVCGGIARYLNMDSTVVRVGFVLSAAFMGAPLLVYLVLTLIMPLESASEF